MRHLKSIPGGVLTLKLPPVESADPVDLARQIREMLTGVSLPPRSRAWPASAAAKAQSMPSPGTSPHLLAAAAAAINWIRTRRAQWSDVRPGDFAHEPVAEWAGAPRPNPTNRYEPREPYEPLEPSEPYDPYATDEADEPDEPRAPRVSYAPLIKAWLPRVAALAVVLGIAGAIVSFWPQIRGVFSSTAARFDRPAAVSEPVEVIAETRRAAAGRKAGTRSALESVRMGRGVRRRSTSSSARAVSGVQVDERGRAMLVAGKAPAALSESRARLRRDAHGRCETG